MKIACLSFSRFGSELAEKIRSNAIDHVDCFHKSDYKAELSRIFGEYDGVVFISSTGIAVRLAAPFLKSKQTDPAIVVIDDTAKYAISLVSGHLGGANELTRNLAKILGCQPIITTASDNRGIEAVDLFAKRNRLVIEDLDAAKQITAMMVDGRRIGFYSPYSQTITYPNLVRNHPEGCIFVDTAANIDCTVPNCLLRPKTLHVGIGCRQGKRADEIMDAIRTVFRSHNLSLKSIRALATIELKKDEPGIKDVCRILECELIAYSKAAIQQVEHLFAQSAFVKENTGVGAVSEPAAYLAGGDLIVKREAIDGITIAVARSKQE